MTAHFLMYVLLTETTEHNEHRWEGKLNIRMTMINDATDRRKRPKIATKGIQIQGEEYEP